MFVNGQRTTHVRTVEWQTTPCCVSWQLNVELSVAGTSQAHTINPIQRDVEHCGHR